MRIVPRLRDEIGERTGTSTHLSGVSSYRSKVFVVMKTDIPPRFHYPALIASPSIASLTIREILQACGVTDQERCGAHAVFRRSKPMQNVSLK